jgi:SAM-dependent methyltransferase
MAEIATTDVWPAEAETVTNTTRCIVCRAARVEPFLDLGTTALANKFLRAEELARPEPRFPLIVGFCHGCGHVQLTEAVPPGAMFEDYLYVSSASDTLRAHLYELSDAVVERFPLGAGDLVIDVGCNDGTLLSGFRRYGVRTLGVDPAKNLAALAEDSGIERVVDFFSAASARRIVDRWGPATIITATNTFPHIPDLHDFMRGIQTALAPGGAFVIEAHYLLDMLEQCAFDTIYHEHVSYWALRPMMHLFAAHGLRATYVERLPIHHGQLRVFVQRAGEGVIDPGVAEMLEAERLLGVGEMETYRLFAEQTQRIRADLRRTLAALRGQGKRVVGYGAPAKGNTLLDFLELGSDVIDYIADRSPLKQGLFTPGTHIPVVSPDRLLAEQPEYVLLLAWNFAEEIMRQLAPYRERGGRFILPVPEVRIV